MRSSTQVQQLALERPPLRLRKPAPADGPAVHALIADCPPLDPNSLYCNLLQCTHFAVTSALAEYGGRTVGFVSGYRPPPHPDTLFVWQVAVARDARGQSIGKRLLRAILERPENGDLRFLRTTVTAGNDASWALFRGLARELGAEGRRETLFDAAQHFNGDHDSEHEFIIGPFDVARHSDQ